jgi:GTPase
LLFTPFFLLFFQAEMIKTRLLKTFQFSTRIAPVPKVFARTMAGFNRGKPHVNIGTIGHVDHGK